MYIYDVNEQRRQGLSQGEFGLPRQVTTENAEAMRTRLCDAAEKLIAERGFEGFTMRALAELAGVSHMTPYGYFEDRQAILAAVRARAFSRHADALEASWKRSTGDAWARSASVARAYLAFAAANPDAYRLMFDVRQPDEAQHPELAAAVARARRNLTQHVDGLIRDGQAAGDPELLAYMFWGGLHGVIMLGLAGKLPDRLPARKILRVLFAHLENGLTAVISPHDRRRRPSRRS